MRIDVTIPVCDLSGAPVKLPDGTLLDLRYAAVTALQTVMDGEKLDGIEKVRRYSLAVKIYNQAQPDLCAEDIALLKQLIDKIFPGPAVVAQCWSILENPLPADAV